MSKKIYEKINEQIKNALHEAKENGCYPVWEKKWLVIQKQNRKSGHIYKGINRFLLASDYNEEFYLTFNQIRSYKKAHLRKGSKSRTVVFWKIYNVADKENEDEVKSIPLLKEYKIFRVSDIDGIPEKEIEGEKDNKKKEDFENWFKNICKKINLEIVIGGSQPCYVPEEDKIYCPDIKRFENSDYYYQTLAHELIHATGNKKRLNRFKKGKENYAKEELVAEIGSAYICNLFKIKLIQHNVAYIDNWINAINEDYSLLVSSSGKAEKALEYLECIEK